MEEKYNVNFAPDGVVSKRGKEVFVEFVKTGTVNATVWSMGTPVSFIWTESKENPFSTSFQAPVP